MARLILDLYKDWHHLDERIEGTVTGEIEELSRVEPKCQRVWMSVPWYRASDLDRPCRRDRHRRGF